MAEEKYDICISCGKITSYKKTDNIIYRSGYIEGAGHKAEIAHLKSLLEPHDTGHIHTTISTLEHRVRELESKGQ